MALSRERIVEKQRYFQNVHNLTHLKGPYDRVFSVFIPWAMAAFVGVGVARGIYHMANGTGKKE